MKSSLWPFTKIHPSTFADIRARCVSVGLEYRFDDGDRLFLVCRGGERIADGMKLRAEVYDPADVVDFQNAANDILQELVGPGERMVLEGGRGFVVSEPEFDS